MNPRDAGHKVADEIMKLDPPSDEVFERGTLLEMGGIGDNPWHHRTFFDALRHRLQDKCGRNMVVVGTRTVRFCSTEETAPLALGHGVDSAMRDLVKAGDIAGRAAKHLSGSDKAEALRIKASLGNLAAHIRNSEEKRLARQAMGAK